MHCNELAETENQSSTTLIPKICNKWRSLQSTGSKPTVYWLCNLPFSNQTISLNSERDETRQNSGSETQRQTLIHVSTGYRSAMATKPSFTSRTPTSSTRLPSFLVERRTTEYCVISCEEAVPNEQISTWKTRTFMNYKPIRLNPQYLKETNLHSLQRQEIVSEGAIRIRWESGFTFQRNDIRHSASDGQLRKQQELHTHLKQITQVRSTQQNPGWTK